MASERPPQWIEVTKENSDAENDVLDETKVNQASNLSATVYKELAKHDQQLQLSDDSSYNMAPAQMTSVNQGPSSVNQMTSEHRGKTCPLPSFKLGANW